MTGVLFLSSSLDVTCKNVWDSLTKRSQAYDWKHERAETTTKGVTSQPPICVRDWTPFSYSTFQTLRTWVNRQSESIYSAEKGQLRSERRMDHASSSANSSEKVMVLLVYWIVKWVAFFGGVTIAKCYKTKLTLWLMQDYFLSRKKNLDFNSNLFWKKHFLKITKNKTYFDGEKLCMGL